MIMFTWFTTKEGDQTVACANITVTQNNRGETMEPPQGNNRHAVGLIQSPPKAKYIQDTS